MVFTINFPGTLHFTLPYPSNTSTHTPSCAKQIQLKIISNFFRNSLNTNENRLGYGLGLEFFCENEYVMTACIFYVCHEIRLEIKF